MAAYWVSIAVSSFVTRLVGFFCLQSEVLVYLWSSEREGESHRPILTICLMDPLSHSRISPPIFRPKKGKFHTKPDNFLTIQYVLTFIVGCCTQKKEIFPTVQYVLTLRQNDCKVGDIEIQLPFWAPFHNSYTSFLIYFQPILLAQNGAGDLSEHILGHFISKI